MARKNSNAPAFPRLTFPGTPPATQEFNRNAETIAALLNGRISLGTKAGAWSGHVDGEVLAVTVPAINRDFPVAHQLGRIPLGWLPLSGDGLLRLNSTPAHSRNQLWLRSNQAAGTRFLILVV